MQDNSKREYYAKWPSEARTWSHPVILSDGVNKWPEDIPHFGLI